MENGKTVRSSSDESLDNETQNTESDRITDSANVESLDMFGHIADRIKAALDDYAEMRRQQDTPYRIPISRYIKMLQDPELKKNSPLLRAAIITAIMSFHGESNEQDRQRTLDLLAECMLQEGKISETLVKTWRNL